MVNFLIDILHTSIIYQSTSLTSCMYVQSQTTNVCTMQCISNFLLHFDNQFVPILDIIVIITTYFNIT